MPSTPVIDYTSAEQLAAEQKAFIFPCVKTLYHEPLVLREGHGCWVTGGDGQEYLDLFAGILSTSIGHCNPEVNARVREQMDRLGHTSTLYITENQIRAARQLASIAPGALQTSLFVNSGSAAIDAAVTLARQYTGNEEVIALRLGYSGNSILATHLTGQSAWRPAGSSMAGIKHALAPYPYRSPFGGTAEEDGEKFAQDIEEVILTTTGGRPAAFLSETIMGVGGFIVPPAGYFQRAAEIIRKYGGLFIADEVQSGFGRTGDHWFGITHWGVEPDIMVMAKGIANGHPVGAVITRPEIAAGWTRKTISTFGGNPVSMSAMEATLEIMLREQVPVRAQIRGKQLRDGLNHLFEKFDWIGEVRGMGLMQGMEIVTDRTSKTPDPTRAGALLQAARENLLLLGIGGIHSHVIRIGPSLLISEEEVDEALTRLHNACMQIS